MDVAGESGERGPHVFRSLKTGIGRLVRAVRAAGRTLGRRGLARERSSPPAREEITSGFTDHERVEAAKYSPPAFTPRTEAEELPDSYGRPRVTLAVVDPYMIYAYWDIDTSGLPRGASSAVLRLYDASDSPAAGPFDVDVDLRARNWYVHLWNPAKSYYADLGVRTLQNGFISLAVSNRVHTPRAWPVAGNPVIEEEPRTMAAAVAAVASVVSAPANEPPPPIAYAQKAPEPVSHAIVSTMNQSGAVVERETPLAPKRVGADQRLQQRLEEIYALRPWRSRAGGEASVPSWSRFPDLTAFASPRDAIEPAAESALSSPASVDLTRLAERQLYPGLPSSLRPTFHRPDSSTS